MDKYDLSSVHGGNSDSLDNIEPYNGHVNRKYLSFSTNVLYVFKVHKSNSAMGSTIISFIKYITVHTAHTVCKIVNVFV